MEATYEVGGLGVGYFFGKKGKFPKRDVVAGRMMLDGSAVTGPHAHPTIRKPMHPSAAAHVSRDSIWQGGG